LVKLCLDKENFIILEKRIKRLIKIDVSLCGLSNLKNKRQEKEEHCKFIWNTTLLLHLKEIDFSRALLQQKKGTLPGAFLFSYRSCLTATDDIAELTSPAVTK